jgi:hypothetical protein
MNLWLRLGDNSDYEKTDFDTVKEILNEIEIYEISQCKGGITAPKFERNNYISLYWGDDESNHIQDITSEEFEEIKNRNE